MLNINFRTKNFNAQKNNTLINSKKIYSNLTTIKCDTVSFGALKKTQFSGIDLLVVNKFKAPIEKFNNNDDFQNWCKEKVKSVIKNDYEGKYYETGIQRNDIIDEWLIYLSDYKYSIHLFTLDSITKDLNSENDNLPPHFDTIVLTETLKEIENAINNNPKYDVNFSKLYQKNLRNSVLKSCVDSLDETKTGWVKIPSFEHDSDNFESNLLKLKLLSSPKWCTTGSTAEKRLDFCDFHIYLEKGVPMIAISIIEDEVGEIEGIKNDLHIPIEYFDLIKEHIKGMKLSETVKREFKDFKIS